jgi:DNA-binding NarL/FixJ family response regulator
MIRVLVADDHALTRRSISSFLSQQNDFAICGEAADGVQAVEQARNLAPDVIVMDLSMPRMDGLTAARVIRQENPSAQIVMISLQEPNVLKEISSRQGLAFVDKANLAGDLIPTLRHIAK